MNIEICWQYYYWFKRSLAHWTDDNPFPVEIDFGMKDMLSSLRPKLKPHSNLQEAADALENLEKELMSKLSQVVTGLLLTQQSKLQVDDRSDSQYHFPKCISLGGDSSSDSNSKSGSTGSVGYSESEMN